MSTSNSNRPTSQRYSSFSDSASTSASSERKPNSGSAVTATATTSAHPTTTRTGARTGIRTRTSSTYSNSAKSVSKLGPPRWRNGTSTPTTSSSLITAATSTTISSSGVIGGAGEGGPSGLSSSSSANSSSSSSTTTSVSRIFAQPQLGSKLRSAVEGLPVGVVSELRAGGSVISSSEDFRANTNTTKESTLTEEGSMGMFGKREEREEGRMMSRASGSGDSRLERMTRSGDLQLQRNGNARTQSGMNAHSSNHALMLGTIEAHGTVLPPDQPVVDLPPVQSTISPSDIEQIVSDESKDATTPKPGMKALDTTQVFSESPKAISDIPLPSTTQPETQVAEVQTANPTSVPLPTPDSAQPVVSITPAAQTTSVDTRNLESTSKDKAGVLLPKLEKTKTKIKEEDAAGRGSWFGSWSRRKGKEVKEGQDVKRNKDGQETATPLPQAQVGIEQNKLVGSGERMREVIDLTGDVPSVTAVGSSSEDPGPSSSSNRRSLEDRAMPPKGSGSQQHSAQSIPFPTSEPEPPKATEDVGSPQSSSHTPPQTSSKTPTITISFLPQPQATNPEKSKPSSSSSWFRSRPSSKEKGKEKDMGRLAGDSPGQPQASNLDSNIGLGLSDVVSAPTIATNSTTVTTMNAGSTITTKATNASTSPVVYSATTSPATATMSPPVPVPLPSSPTDAMSNHASASISSVDSEVPPPHVPGSPVAYSAVDTPLLNVEPRERKLSVSSLNPSSSRFVLRIPLLGRPKVPLEQVVGVVGVKEKERQMGDGRKGEGTEREEVKVGSGGSVPREESTASESSQSPNLSDPQTPPPSAAQAALSAVHVTSEGDVKAELDAPSIPINESSQVATDSRGLESGVNYGWWGYLGWGGGGSSSPQQSSDQDPKENMTSEHPNSSTIATSTSTTSTPTVVISQAQGRTEGAKQGQGQGDAEQQAKEGNPDITVTSGSGLESQGESRGAMQSQSRSTADEDGLRVGNGEEGKSDSNSRSKETPGYDRGGDSIPAETTGTANKREGEGEGKSPSILSASKSQGSSPAVWYYPWVWYSPTLPAPSADANANKGEGEDQTTEGKKTESEMVKEEALARDDPSESSAAIPGSAQPQEQKQQKEDQNEAQTQGGGGAEVHDTGRVTIQETLNAASATNPIETSISTNKTGWASFFMSRALLTKMITDGSEKEREKEVVERDENGVEVMNIDEDEDGGNNEARLVVSSGTPPSARRSSAGSSAGKELVLRPSQLQPSSSASPPKTPSSPTPSSKRPEREPKKSDPPAPPLTNSDSIKRETVKGKGSGGATMSNGTDGRAPSPAPSKKSGYASPTPSQNQKVQTPNLVLPTWSDTFHAPPRSIVPPPPPPKAGPSTVREKISGAIRFVGGMLFAQTPETKDGSKEHTESTRMRYPSRRSSSLGHTSGKGKERERVGEVTDEVLMFGKELPKALDVLGESMDATVLNGECKVVVIGVAGWSPGAVTRTIAGGFPSPSSKFVSMTCQALERFEDEHEFKFKKITSIALEGDGAIERKVTRVHAHLLGNQEWMDDLHAADMIFVATHSQGSIIVTHLLSKLIQEGHILTPRNIDILTSAAAAIVPGGVVGAPFPTPASSSRTQRICCLALCGIHLGPLRYLKTSSLLGQYIQYFENAAARELFEFQNTDSQLSKDYVKALRTVMDHGAKMVYVASLNDQVVPIYSGLFTAASHPRILRALYIDGDAYHSSDFLANLLVLLIRILNSGLSDSGLLGHLSEATAGTLSGVGHSSAYEELDTFSLAVKYAFQVNEGVDVRTDLVVEPFNAVNEQNDYEIPWSLRDLIADDRVAHFFADEFAQLRDGFDDWAPKTSILRDVKRKLQPIQRLASIKGKGKPYSRL